MAHGRYDLTEFEWNVIKPLLPNKARGVPRVDDQRVLNGIFYQLRSGSPWADLPKGTSLLADRGYDADWIREMIEDQNCTPVIPPKSNRREAQKAAQGHIRKTVL